MWLLQKREASKKQKPSKQNKNGAYKNNKTGFLRKREASKNREASKKKREWGLYKEELNGVYKTDVRLPKTLI